MEFSPKVNYRVTVRAKLLKVNQSTTKDSKKNIRFVDLTSNFLNADLSFESYQTSYIYPKRLRNLQGNQLRPIIKTIITQDKKVFVTLLTIAFILCSLITFNATVDPYYDTGFIHKGCNKIKLNLSIPADVWIGMQLYMTNQNLLLLVLPR